MVFQRALLIIFGVIMTLNVVAFTAVGTNPFINEDDWFFLQSVVMQFNDGQFDLRDLYRMRDHTDHALPVHKLVMLASAQWFHLDSRFQAFVGVLCAVILAALICWRILATVAPGRSRIGTTLVIILVLSVFFSLNSTRNYTRWLVTLGYLSLCASFLLFLAVDGAIHRRPISMGKVAIATAIALVGGDDLGVLSVICSLAVLVMISIRDQRKDLLKLALCLLVVLLAYRYLVYTQLVSYVRGYGSISLRKGLTFFLQEPLQIYKALVIPFANSVLHRPHFDRLFGAWGQMGHTLLGFAVLGLHIGAWWRYIRDRGYQITAIPCLMLLLSYLALAGIFMVRVSAHGYDYFNSPRYMHMYQFGLVGAIWMWYLCPMQNAGVSARRMGNSVTLALLIGLSAAALFSTVTAWSQVRFYSAQQRHYAKYLVKLGDEPDGVCPKIYVICGKYKPEARKEMIAFLHDHNLNVFKPGDEYGLRPDLNNQ